MTYLDGEGEEHLYLGGMQGELLYHPSGFMSLHLSPTSYNSFKGDFSNFDSSQSLNKLKHISMFYSYSADYRIENDSTVEHLKRIHSNPNEWGSRSRRHFHIRNDTMFMRPAEEKLSHIQLIWIKN